MSDAQAVLASSNHGKLGEIAAILDGCGLTLCPQSDFGLSTPPETGGTFCENALIKARYVCEQTGLAALADDSGLEVDVLGGAPGVHSARYAGDNAVAGDNLKLLVENIAQIEESRLSARFFCAAVHLEPGGQPLIAEAVWEGRLVKSPRGKGGFGYDPVFFVDEYGCTAAELTPEIKNRISHRARAFAWLRELLTATY